MVKNDRTGLLVLIRSLRNGKNIFVSQPVRRKEKMS